ncbi:MAG: AIPR family protein [Solobacterium sp.]|nr:AIPR family protein [Solobacterium sp.]
MSKELTITEFYKTINEEIQMARDTETFGWEDQDFFTAVILDYLEEVGEVEDPIICPFRGYGLQLNAYSISEDYENVEIYVSIYKPDDSIQSVSRTDIDAAIKRAIQLYRKATNDLFESFEKDSDTYEFAISLHNHCDDIKKVKIIALTNGLVKSIDLKNLDLSGVEISFSVWDMDRLYRCFISGKMRETIEIDFLKEYNISIPCIENKTSDKYSVYLAIISGELLASIYETHGPRLLERNVRSFLQVKGAVNKGIRDTLRDEPDMFLAYNNGISVTAEEVEISRDENGKPSICRIRDMQIVNGGQTTASIYNAWKDKKINADLSKVFVQMKLSVIDNIEDMNTIVPKISAFANTQNKIQMADFSANDPYHRKIEELSRITWAPSISGSKPMNWFYERARGQYADMLSKETTTLRRKEFKNTHPLFTKTDLAKYENSWDQLPYQVSEGAQKNFKKFTLKLKDRGNFIPDISYYQRLIAKAILFRRTEKLVQLQQYGGYRANIVTYTIAYLSYVTGQRIDLERIWKEQATTPALDENIISISRFVHDIITNPPGGANVSEWCKKTKCWETVRDYKYCITDDLEQQLINMANPKQVVSNSDQASRSSLNEASEEERLLITRAREIPAKTWYALSRWAKETDNFQGWQRSIVFSVGQLIARGKTPSFKQANQALIVYDEAINKGFKL